MKAPYLMSREEWERAREDLRPYGHFTSKLTKGSGSQEAARIQKIIDHNYNVGAWWYNLACKGHQWAVELSLKEPVRFCDVVLKALWEGKDVPDEICNEALKQMEV